MFPQVRPLEMNLPPPSHHVMDESGNVSKSNRRDPVPMELVISKKTLTEGGVMTSARWM